MVANSVFLDQTMELLDEVLLFEHNRKLQGPIINEHNVDIDLLVKDHKLKFKIKIVITLPKKKKKPNDASLLSQKGQ